MERVGSETQMERLENETQFSRMDRLGSVQQSMRGSFKEEDVQKVSRAEEAPLLNASKHSNYKMQE